MIKLMQCSACGSYGRIDKEIAKEQLPIVLVCSGCDNMVEWKEKIPILPKVQPSTLPSCAWTVLEYKEQQEQEQLIENIAVNQSQDNFFELADEIGKTSRLLFEKVEGLQSYITNFKQQIENYYKHKWEFAKRILKWNNTAFLDFLHFPFSSINVQCDNQLAQQYTKWVLYPSFFGTELGMPIARNPGMNIDLVTSYTRLQFPLESSFARALRVPETLDLEVKGAKILGASLPFTWQDIPGTVRDIDHTDDWPSISMKDKSAARQWLVQHGVKPYMPVPISSSEIIDWEADDLIFENKHLRDAWLVFKQTGRLGLFWQEKQIKEARKFVWLMSQKIKGIVIIFVGSKQDKDFYQVVFEAYKHTLKGSQQFHTVGAWNNKVVIVEPDEPLVWDAVLRCSLIAVDLYSGVVNPEILTNLYNYRGKLLVVGGDPIMDLQGENYVASLVYGLAGWVRFNPIELQRYSGYKEYEDVRDIKEFIKGMKS